MIRRSSPVRYAAALLVLGVLAAACSSVSPEELADRYRTSGVALEPASTLPPPTLDEGEPSSADLGNMPSDDGRSVRNAPLQPRFGECPFDVGDLDVDCGRITVPSDDDTDDIEIAFARFNAERDGADDPVVYLHGGPGEPVLASAGLLYSALVAPFVAERDVIVYDQRGAGESSPLPPCTEAWDLDPAFFGRPTPHAELSDAYNDALFDCADRLQRRSDIELSEYASAVHADDLVDLVWALDYREVNLYGISYGSRLGQTVLRDHPEIVRSAVLSGIYPIEENLLGSTPAAFEQAMLEVFAACATDPACDELLPDPLATLEAWIDRLDAEPAVIALPYDEQSSFSFSLSGDDLLNILHGLLYGADSAALIPDLLIDLEAGDRNRLERLAPAGIFDNAAVVAYLVVQCREEAPFTTPEEQALAERQETLWDRIMLPPGFLGEGLIEVCAGWPEIGVAEPLENEPATWIQPTLVMSGAFDPITPPEWGEAMAARLPNATFVYVPDRGHDADDGICSATVISSFIDDPSGPVDLSCVDADARLALTNSNVEVFDRNDPALEDSIFDIDPTDEIEWIDMRLPTWPADFFTDHEVYWRNVDVFDDTVIVIRAGEFDGEELTAYLPFEVRRSRFAESDTPAEVGDGWIRRAYDTDGMDIVSYVSTGPVAMNVSVVAGDDDIAEIERRALIPMVESVAFG
ncbi:MAG: alpha/beta fold hydrolase [Actinomycetota bacterium]